MEISHCVIQIAAQISIRHANVCGSGGGIRSHHKGSEPTTLECQGHVQTGCMPCFPWGVGSAAAGPDVTAGCDVMQAAGLVWRPTCSDISLRQKPSVSSQVYSNVHLWP
jgi:hypothetical protein